jgi:hypothetical protein
MTNKMLEEDIRMSISVLISPFPQLFHKGTNKMERIIRKSFATAMVLTLCLALGTAAQAAVQDGILVAHCF